MKFSVGDKVQIIYDEKYIPAKIDEAVTYSKFMYYCSSVFIDKELLGCRVVREETQIFILDRLMELLYD